jgi:hypothetical protein
MTPSPQPSHLLAHRLPRAAPPRAITVRHPPIHPKISFRLVPCVSCLQDFADSSQTMCDTYIDRASENNTIVRSEFV